MLDPVLTLPEACERLRISRRTAARLISRGELVGVRIGRCWRFRVADVERLLTPPRVPHAA